VPEVPSGHTSTSPLHSGAHAAIQAAKDARLADNPRVVASDRAPRTDTSKTKSPGRWSTGRHGSNFISPDNDDYAANHMWHALRDAGVDRSREVVSWNLVPWFVGDAQTNDEVTDRDISEGLPLLLELLDLLRPNPKVVVVLGKKAQQGWTDFGLHRKYRTVEAPMPDPRSFGRWPEKVGELRRALAAARRIAGYE
jgi:Uracil DNA glycosylase superfamily